MLSKEPPISAAAVKAVEAAGGTVTTVDLPKRAAAGKTTDEPKKAVAKKAPPKKTAKPADESSDADS